MEDYLKLEENFKETFHTSSETVYYIISRQWLDFWKQSPDSKDFPPINNDIVAENLKTVLKYCPINSHMWNKVLKPGLQEGIDYEIINEKMWKFLSSKKKIANEITRDSIVVNGIKTVNVYLQQIKIAPIFPNSVNKFKGGMKT